MKTKIGFLYACVCMATAMTILTVSAPARGADNHGYDNHMGNDHKDYKGQSKHNHIWICTLDKNDGSKNHIFTGRSNSKKEARRLAAVGCSRTHNPNCNAWSLDNHTTCYILKEVNPHGDHQHDSPQIDQTHRNQNH